ncbi:glycosyltransferase family 4 protein [Oculatella sp. LEGE 06141]|uniref:glycosyltransferase n=1 Tax=Oculatella sp. LEGE 06141 TaxID=1828648 RepID=UPI00187EF855|nr:glycosyltransferase [Oculatella sp. LEGE 06141]MBE9180446.1 glycosyltransferase family 4 protein [Oculatella sp. LEGE 06141]
MPLRILTWHVHGSYLYYLTQSPHEFYLPVKPDHPEGYGGRLGGFPWGNNVHDIAADDVKHQSFDCILFQSRRNYLHDQYEILSAEQQQLPRLYLEHDPPREHPTDTQHVVNDPDILLVHVTHFNRLMWDSGNTPTCVIEHGVMVPDDVHYTGDLPKGIVVANGLRHRGRRLGSDIFQQVQKTIPLDLVGMDAESLGGIGEVAHHRLPSFQSRYRFFFHPVRYTSLGLAVCEAMMIGLPIVGLATTELGTVIENGVSGYIDTDVDRLIERMQDLIAHPKKARLLGEGAREQARSRFNIHRFIQDWTTTFEQAVSRQPQGLEVSRKG